MKYDSLNDSQKIEIITQLYHDSNMSWRNIASQFDTYPNKIYRDAKRLGIESRDKSEAQKIALQEGRSEHRTEGKQRSEEVKRKISESNGKVWDELTDEERQERSDIGKAAWNNKTEEEKQEVIRRGGNAVRKASKFGSKLETYISENLMIQGYSVERHKDQWLKNVKLHIDILIPTLITAIEVDGPSHFKPIWGEESLDRVQLSDMEKTGLILGQGFCLIRVKQIQRLTQRYQRNTFDKIFKVIKQIETKFPKEHERYYEII